MDHSPTMMKIIFGQCALNNVCNQVLGELMAANTAKISDSNFIKVINTINAMDSKKISVREGKRDLLTLAATMNNTMGNVIEGLANLQTNLCTKNLLTFGQTPSVQRSCSMTLGVLLDSVKPRLATYPPQKQAVNLDIFRLGITCKRAIERHDLLVCLAFIIKGYSISFFIVSKRHDCLYTMMEIASLDFASSLSNLHTFAIRKILDLLAAVSYCFWSTCVPDLP
ncbi:hypothetical protein BDB00DRAFT_869069 [Zychaea mexicana]|uniref:uncharacterized protein n=1 Tax=Zychaea mexicana TaxID=64656 RepID=UPI0022FDEBF6|nr:uncharacterized protein BDB00DRAFT_869069 [Zychaea mexicana]KAI9496841.1 hypothetical protein BDB00DRAFT_869069 [Zychaea mexicana]